MGNESYCRGWNELSHLCNIFCINYVYCVVILKLWTCNSLIIWTMCYCINYVYCVHCICFGCHYGLNIQSELHSELALGLHTHTIWMKQQYWKFWILLQKCSAMHLNYVESRPWSYSKHSEYYRIQRQKKTLAGCCYSQLWILMCNMCRSYCNLSSINTLFWTVGLNVHMAWIHTKSLSSFSNSITPMFMVREHLQDHDSDHD